MTLIPGPAPAAPGAIPDDMLTGAVPAAASTRAADALYRAAWRWHFYAGLYVVPFLLVLAVTGFAMMLLTTYWPEHGERLRLAPASAAAAASGEALAPEAQLAAAVAAVPGGTGWSEYVTAYAPENPVRITVAGPDTPVVVALDPATGEALRLTPEGSTWNAWLEEIHGTLLLGWVGDRLIEVAAGLGLIMVATGLYLWWPRERGAGRALRDVLVPRLSARGRAAWRSWHAVGGFWASAALLAFLVTGMAWTGVWGERWVQAWSTFPAERSDAVPLSDLTHASLNGAGGKDVPWGLEQTPLPLSGSEAGTPLADVAAAAEPHHEGANGGGTLASQGGGDAAGQRLLNLSGPPDLDTLLGLAWVLRMDGRVHVTPPADATGVWTLSQDSMSYDGPDPTSDRTVHVDRYTGNVLADVGFIDYGLAAKSMAVGLALHEGQMGFWNVALNGGACLLIAFLCLSGMVMWWKRRPKGAWRLAAPPRPELLPLWKGAFALAVALSMLFPLVGVTLVGVALLDATLVRWVPGLRRTLA